MMFVFFCRGGTQTPLNRYWLSAPLVLRKLESIKCQAEDFPPASSPSSSPSPPCPHKSPSDPPSQSRSTARRPCWWSAWDGPPGVSAVYHPPRKPLPIGHDLGFDSRRLHQLDFLSKKPLDIISYNLELVV